MREIHRSAHSGFETLRLLRQAQHRDALFNRKPFPAFEQMTALGMTARMRPPALFGDRSSR
jgi:hypothetical protein